MVAVTRGEPQVVSGGVSGLRVLKTTASGCSGFHAGRYSTLPATDDRVLTTEVDVEWTFKPGWGDAGDPLTALPGGGDAAAAAAAAEEAAPAAAASTSVRYGDADAASSAKVALLAAFFGDAAAGGVHGPGMQRTLVAMGASLLADPACAGIRRVLLSLPNLRFLSAGGGGVLPLLGGDLAAARVYVATEEPRVVISAVVKRT